MKKFRLYVWSKVLTDYTSGIAVAAASSVGEAREVLIKRAEEWERGVLAGDISGEPKVFELPDGWFCWGGG